MSLLELLKSKRNATTPEKEFLSMIKEATEMFLVNGSRSNKKVNIVHEFIKKNIERIINDNGLDGYEVKLEHSVASVNSSGKKRCDIVILKCNIPYLIIPCKFIMSNYMQNKNNFWENLTGEIVHLKMANKNLYILPINIVFNKVPYLKENKKIKKFEEITLENSYSITSELVKWNFCEDVLNFIIDVEHVNKEEENYTIAPSIVKMNDYTPYNMISILEKYLIK